MLKPSILLTSLLSLLALETITALPSEALPNYSVDQVKTWIMSNQNLQGHSLDGLNVTRQNTPAQRFYFNASIFPPFPSRNSINYQMIRSEKISFFDMLQGVTFKRLEESLRSIYGVDIYQDYLSGDTVYQYPTAEMIDRAERQNLPLLRYREGKLILGKRYAYWLEIVNTEQGLAYNGQITVLSQSDLTGLQETLQRRE